MKILFKELEILELFGYYLFLGSIVQILSPKCGHLTKNERIMHNKKATKSEFVACFK